MRVIVVTAFAFLTLLGSQALADPSMNNTNTTTSSPSPHSSPNTSSGSGESGQPGQPGGSSNKNTPTPSVSVVPNATAQPQTTTRKKPSSGSSDPGEAFAPGLDQPGPTVNLAAGPPPPDTSSGPAPDSTEPASDTKPKGGLKNWLAGLLGLGAAGAAASGLKSKPDPCMSLDSKFDSAMAKIAAHRNFLRSQIATAKQFPETGLDQDDLESQLAALDSGAGPLNDEARAILEQKRALGCEQS